MRVLFVLITFILIGCSNKELDRDKAFDLIKQHYEYPNVETMRFPGISYPGKINREFKNLLNENYISVKRKDKYGHDYWIYLTYKGDPFKISGKVGYNGYVVASNITRLDKVTGIKFNQGKNEATVEFNTKKTDITPFGLTKDNAEKIRKHSVTMELYDDGWRVTSNKPNTIIKVDDVKGFDKNYMNELQKVDKLLTQESGKSPCIIKKIYSKYGADFMVVDYVKYAGTYEESDAPRYENNNPKLRTFLLADDTKLHDVYGKTFVGKDLQKKINIGSYYDISVTNGVVRHINEIYFP